MKGKISKQSVENLSYERKDHFPVGHRAADVRL